MTTKLLRKGAGQLGAIITSLLLAASSPAIAQTDAGAEKSAKGAGDVAPAVRARQDGGKAAQKGDKPNAVLSRIEQSLDTKMTAARRKLERGWAATDIGMQLLNSERADAASEYFRAAEKELSEAAKLFAEGESHWTAQALYALAHVRATYLNDVLRADDAMQEAAKLAPKDAAIQEAKKDFDAKYGGRVKQLRALLKK